MFLVFLEAIFVQRSRAEVPDQKSGTEVNKVNEAVLLTRKAMFVTSVKNNALYGGHFVTSQTKATLRRSCLVFINLPFSVLTRQLSDPYSPFFFGPFFWESSSPFFSSPESSDLAFRFSLLSSMLSLFSFDSFFAVVVLLGAWRGKRVETDRHLEKSCRNS